MLMPGRNLRVILLVILLLSLASLACGLTLPRATFSTPTARVEVVPVIPTASPPQIISITDQEKVLVELYSRYNPSVVNITVYLSQDRSLGMYAQGSGFVYDDQGHIITNAHVVNGVDVVEITFADGLIRQANLVGMDLFSDLAVVKTDLPAGITPIPMGSMDKLAVGQTVVAIGNPFGFEGTLTSGIISALGRTIPSQTQYSIPEAIQTDAAINPGNSGGPLLNLSGEVVGVVDQIETTGASAGNVGVGFAIPVSIVQRVVPALISQGSYDWPWLGVVGYTIYPALVKAMNLPVEQGAYVSAVTADSPAMSAGLIGAKDTVTQDGFTVEVGGDVITAIDGHPVKTFDDLLVYLSLHTSPGQEVTLTILRDGKYKDVKLVLGSRPVE